jgi:nucleoside-diphosphate-sugar epimerase
MLKVLITGYSGFIGSHLVDELKSKFQINLLGRTKPSLGCQYLNATINNHSDYSSILDSVDVVIHVAARTHIMNDTEICPLDEFRAVNVKGTLNLAQQAANKGVKRFIYISSIKVNGEKTSPGHPFTQIDEKRPVDDYGLSKSEAEEQLEKLSKLTGIEYVSIRPPLVYGKGVKANFSALMTLVRNKVPLPLSAIKNNSRSLVSVYNLVDLIKTCIDHPNASNQTFLVSDDEDLSTSEMVRLMAKAQSVKTLLFPVPVWMLRLLGRLMGKSDIISRLTDSLEVDITHTKQTLDWKPLYSVEEGFAKCVKIKKGKITCID